MLEKWLFWNSFAYITVKDVYSILFEIILYTIKYYCNIVPVAGTVFY